MSTTCIDPAPVPLRDLKVCYKVASRTDPHITYDCELLDYDGNGQCHCTDFLTRFAPLLQKMVGPEEALAQKLVTLRPWQRKEDALRCWHLVEAHRQFHKEALAHLVAERRAANRGHHE